ncbi:transposase, partial [Shigella sonnei]|uniref:transposase n=1 Tax=Shigella sonnei TaxID=624 RepID=UPI0011BD1C6C
MKNSENELAEQLIEQTGDNTLTLMDKGYYSLGLLNAWSLAGEHRHWGKVCHLLTSMTDAMRFPGGEMADLYSNRWEIELGYREIKQTMQLSRLTLRSKKPELVEQELWGV